MSTKRKASKAKGRGVWHGFINHNITKTDIAAIKEMADAGESHLSKLAELVESGYTFKISYDDYSGCPSIMMLGQEDSGSNHGWAISARHTDLNTAVCELLYKHRVFVDDEGGWLKPMADTERYNY